MSSATETRNTGRSVSSWVLALIAVVVLGFGLWLGMREASEFVGTDSAATESVEESNPGYEPWFASIFSPGSGEIESGLFALQAAIGAGFAGFALGTYRERSRERKKQPSADST